MTKIKNIVTAMRINSRNIRFADLERVCRYYFGAPRVKGPHYFFTVPWQGEPLVNIQNYHGMAKSYQVRQVLAAIDLIEAGEDDAQG